MHFYTVLLTEVRERYTQIQGRGRKCRLIFDPMQLFCVCCPCFFYTRGVLVSVLFSRLSPHSSVSRDGKSESTNNTRVEEGKARQGKAQKKRQVCPRVVKMLNSRMNRLHLQEARNCSSLVPGGIRALSLSLSL